MSKVCSGCEELNPNKNEHCGTCGRSLGETTSQVFRQVDNRGGSLNAPHSNSGPVSIITNQSHDSYHRPPLDLAPTLPPREVPSLTSQTKIAYGILSVAATFCTLFGISFSEFFKYIPFVGDFHWQLLFYALVLSGPGLMLLMKAYVLKTNGHIVDKAGMSVLQEGGAVLRYTYRCICPISHCGGVMEPKKKVVDTKVIWEWVCRRNEDHRMLYDPTQIDHAIKSGQLNEAVHDNSQFPL